MADFWLIDVASGQPTCITRRERPWLDETRPGRVAR